MRVEPLINSARSVSILVLVDSSLRQMPLYSRPRQSSCFNPCFSGFVITTHATNLYQFWQIRFNPCFSGFVITTSGTVHLSFSTSRVSILVLVDSSLRLFPFACHPLVSPVSILVLVDSSLRLCYRC